MNYPPFYSLISASNAFNSLKNDFSCSKLSHAYLISSQDSLLTSTLSRMFCALILGGENAVYNGTHADVHQIPKSLGGEKRDTVRTADIDELISGLYIKPSKGDKKFYIIDYGETMNASCQNKLLKSLEEPPPSAYFIINTLSKSALLPTVVSRCRCIEPQGFTKDEILEGLTELFPKNNKLDFAASASRGSLDSAYKMAIDKKYSQVFDTALVSLITLENSQSVLASAARMNNYKDGLDEFLSFYEIIFRDVLVKNTTSDELIMLSCYDEEITKLAKSFSAKACLAILPEIIQAQKKLNSNANKLSVIDGLLFSIAFYKTKYKLTT